MINVYKSNAKFCGFTDKHIIITMLKKPSGVHWVWLSLISSGDFIVWYIMSEFDGQQVNSGYKQTIFITKPS